MKLLFTWVVALGILAGFCGSALAADPCAVMLAMHAQEHAGHHHDSEHPCDPSHDQDCPVEHHHHGACCHAMPLADMADLMAGLAAPMASLSRFRPEGEVAPDGPCLSEDEPPLI